MSIISWRQVEARESLNTLSRGFKFTRLGICTCKFFVKYTMNKKMTKVNDKTTRGVIGSVKSRHSRTGAQVDVIFQ